MLEGTDTDIAETETLVAALQRHDPCAATLLNGFLVPISAIPYEGSTLSPRDHAQILAWYLTVGDAVSPDVPTEIRPHVDGGAGRITELIHDLGVDVWIAAAYGEPDALQLVEDAVANSGLLGAPEEPVEAVYVYLADHCMPLLEQLDMDELFALFVSDTP